MGLFRKSIKHSKSSKDLDNKIKNLDEDLKRAGIIAKEDDEIFCVEKAQETNNFKIIDGIDLVESKEDKLYNWRETIVEESTEHDEEDDKEVSEHRNITKVEYYISESNKELILLRDQVFEEISKETLLNLPEIKNKISKVLEIYEQIQEGLLNEPPETKNDDPLTPLNQNFITVDDLNKHYNLFINRIQEQIATIGGGGETKLQYLDDIVGIATNASAYDNKYLKYNHTIGKFEFSSIASSGSQDLNDTLLLGNTSSLGMSVGIITSTKVRVGGSTTFTEDLVVTGNARVTGILTIGTSSITLNGLDDTITIGNGVTITSSGNANYSGVITATSFVGDGSNLSGVITSIVGYATEGYVDAAVSGVSTFSGDYNDLTNKPSIPSIVGLASEGYVDAAVLWESTTAGIHTLSSVGIGTTNPTSALTVKGNTSLETLNVSGVSTFSGNINTNGSNIKLGDGNEVAGNQIKLGNGGSPDAFGDSADLWIYHNPSYGNVFQDITGTGVEIWTNEFKVASPTDPSVTVFSVNPTSSTELYYGSVGGSSSSKKLETLGVGVTVTGTTFTNQLSVSGVSTFTGNVSFGSSALFGDSQMILLGSDNDLEIFHNGGAAGYIRNYTGNLAIQSPGELEFRTPTGFYARFTESFGALLYDNNNQLRLQTLGAGVTVTGTTFTNQLSVSGVSTFNVSTFNGGTYYNSSVYYSNNPTRAYFGSLNEMSIYSTGTYLGKSYNFIDASSGYLDIRNYRTTIRNSENTTQRDLAVFDANTFNAEFVKLYYGGNEKFATIGVGVTVTGTTFTDNLSVSGVSTFSGDGTNAYLRYGSVNAYTNFVTTYNVSQVGGVPLISADANGAALSADTTLNGAYWRIRTLSTGAEINGTLESNQLSVSGVSTCTGSVRVGVSTAAGVILTSPNGTKYQLFVENDGTLKTVLVP